MSEMAWSVSSRTISNRLVSSTLAENHPNSLNAQSESYGSYWKLEFHGQDCILSGALSLKGVIQSVWIVLGAVCALWIDCVGW